MENALRRSGYRAALALLAAMLVFSAGPVSSQETDAKSDQPAQTEGAGDPAAQTGDAGAEEYKTLSSDLELPSRGGRILPVPTNDPALPLLDESIDATKRAYSAYQRGFYLTAMDLALSRAQLGDAAAQTLVAELFSEGLGVARNMEDAAFWYKQAAGNGNASAQFKYAIMLLEGKFVDRDQKTSQELMKKAADAGNAFAQFNHAQSLVADHPGDAGISQALPYFEKSAAQGVADAEYALAQIYMNALGIPEEKRSEARDWMRRAAISGYDTAQLDLGIWMIDGVGGEKDYDRGFRWMQIAANRGNVVAQNRLAVLYVNAIGTRPDPVEAAKWYIISKRAGYNDPSLDDFYQGLTAEEQKEAIDRANKFARR
jgi:uncharacterized protein